MGIDDHMRIGGVEGCDCGFCHDLGKGHSKMSLTNLNRRDVYVVARVYRHKETLKVIGDRLGISRERVRMLRDRGMRMLEEYANEIPMEELRMDYHRYWHPKSVEQ